MTKGRRRITFMNWVNRKYRKELGLPPTARKFLYWDDYAIWLYFEKFKQDEAKYYEALEDDIKAYSDEQTGKEEDSFE